ncbi:hypothetical protein PR048_009747 [Dryococelus australis]|uniref:Uncharacterized protein n=1 Tax=Dryococelus australis TaxID=614101 RepID=A0ABQ9I0U5_9NEOP|nr:hypothetical protein PR048_009747 [Dryococelus australis]
MYRECVSFQVFGEWMFLCRPPLFLLTGLDYSHRHHHRHLWGKMVCLLMSRKTCTVLYNFVCKQDGYSFEDTLTVEGLEDVCYEL